MKVQYQYQTDLGMLYIVQEDDAIAEVGILQPNQIIPYEKKGNVSHSNCLPTIEGIFSGRTADLSIAFSAEGDSVSTEGMEDITNHSLR